MARHPKVFSPLYVSMVRAGETGGLLEDCLMRVADQLEKEDALRRQVKSAMVYPTVVISFAMIVLIALVTFIVPVFAKRLQGVRRQAAGAHALHVELSHLDHRLLVRADHRRVVAVVVGFTPLEALRAGPRRSGTASGCASR